MTEFPDRSVFPSITAALRRGALVLLAWLTLLVPGNVVPAFAAPQAPVWWIITCAALFAALAPLLAVGITEAAAYQRGLLPVLKQLPIADFRTGPAGQPAPPLWISAPEADRWHIGSVQIRWFTRDPDAHVLATVETAGGLAVGNGQFVELPPGSNRIVCRYLSGWDAPIPPEERRIEVLRHRWLLDLGQDGVITSNEGRPISLPLEVREPGRFGRPIFDLAGTVELRSGRNVVTSGPLTGAVRNDVAVILLSAPNESGRYDLHITLRTLRLSGRLSLPLIVIPYDYGTT